MGYTLDQLQQMGATPGPSQTGTDLYNKFGSAPYTGSNFGEQLLQDPLKTLIVKPATRVGQAISAPFVQNEMDTTTDIQNQQTDQLNTVLQRMKTETDPAKKADLHTMALKLVNQAAQNTYEGQQAVKAQDQISDNEKVAGMDIEGQRGGAEGVQQIAGDALKSASYLAGGEGAGEVAGEAGAAGKIIKGTTTGAKVGAMGGAGQSLEDPNATVGSVAKGAAEGTAIGAAAGAGIPAAVEGASAFGKGLSDLTSGAAKDSQQAALDAIKVPLSKSDQAEAVAKGQATIGKGGKVVINPSKQDLRVASTLQPMFEDGRLEAPSNPQNVLHNIATVQDELTASTTKVRQGLQQLDQTNPQPWKQSELIKRIYNTEEPLSIKSTDTAQQNLDNSVFTLISEAPKTREGLLDLRQQFDNLVRKDYPNLYEKDMTPTRIYIRNLRNTLNDFTEEQIPEGKLTDGTGFRDELRRQSDLITAKDYMSEQFAHKYPEGSTAWSRFLKDHPIARRIGWRVLVGSGLSALGVYGAARALNKSITSTVNGQ